MCCGSARAAGLLPQTSFLLGQDDGSAPRYVRVVDASILPNAPQYAYVRGSAVDQAIEEGKLEDVSATAIANRSTKRTKSIFTVTMPSGEVIEFDQYNPARTYSIRNGGSLAVIKRSENNA
jgi:hypothetical protein